MIYGYDYLGGGSIWIVKAMATGIMAVRALRSTPTRCGIEDAYYHYDFARLRTLIYLFSCHVYLWCATVRTGGGG